MTVSQNLASFHGLPVQDFKQPGSIPDFSVVASAVRCEYDDPDLLADRLTALLDEPGSDRIEALVLGFWAQHGQAIDVTSRETIETLVANKDRLPRLKALFVGDITYEENEISWIQNSDMSAIWSAFSRLEEFGARGANGLRLGKINHPALRKLVVECGGLPAALADEALEANAPLEHFELWLGVDEYGLTTQIGDFDDLFAGKLFPRLKTLALRNSDFADEIAIRLATAPILERIEHLDLSMGTLRDPGAEALAASGRIAHLKSLDIHHHYVSDGALEKLAAATPNLLAGKAEEPHEWRGELSYYVSVSE